MARRLLSYTARGFRDARGRFSIRRSLLVKGRRDALRKIGRLVTAALKKNAPNKTGVFAKGLFYRTYERGYKTIMRTYAGGPHGYLLSWIIDGTDPHPIPKGGSAEMMAKGYPLRFYWPKGPQGAGVYRFWSVNHPGTDPNPFIDKTADQVEEEVYRELQKVAVSVVRG